MRHNKIYSVSNAIINFVFLLITTSESAVGNQCPVGTYFSVTSISCSGECACPSVTDGENSGEILSQTGEYYPNNADCKWIISSDDVINILFTRFSTEGGYDGMKIFTCTSSLCDTTTRLAWFSGTYTYLGSLQYTSTTGHLLIHFKSDAWEPDTGFAIQWSVDNDRNDTNTCAQCVAGKYKSDPDNAKCTDCMSNQYSIEVGATTNTCQSCPANSVSSPARNDYLCNAGWTRLDEGGLCVQCAAGKYKVQTGNDACVHCAAGKFSNRVGAQVESGNCLNCGVGKSTNGYDARTDASWCKQCVPGRYASEQGQAHCTYCIPGKYLSDTGSSEGCDNCPPNTYSMEWVATTVNICQSCPANSVSPAGSNHPRECKCVSGSILSTGSCVLCDFGKYNS